MRHRCSNCTKIEVELNLVYTAVIISLEKVTTVDDVYTAWTLVRSILTIVSV